MLDFLKKKKQATGERVSFKIGGMHCTSCSMNIDGELEDLNGVMEATTSYPKSQTDIEYNPKKVSCSQLREVIEGLGYRVDIIQKV